eukprot:TRINITY_DN974_c0_g1_i1.p1 TRINITY_DN974_c0_g1~~TRINITY_DN974_c0_g1_i1.p1  ORF type:complete len:186 (-),score=37.25 TRINITY_DN974_c0_g1_i1:17-574(-)
MKASNSSKILINAASESTEVFVYGKPGDDELLKSKIETENMDFLLLYPDATSITVTEFLEKIAVKQSKEEDTSNEREICIIVLDGTWHNTRFLHKHFDRTISKSVPHVRINPTRSSKYTRMQSTPDRVCTLEAIGFLLEELGETTSVEKLLDYLLINNKKMIQTNSGLETKLKWLNVEDEEPQQQ